VTTMSSTLQQPSPVPPSPSSLVERALQTTDYIWARGRIDVVDNGETVRSCRFGHEPLASKLEVQCSIEAVTYRGDAHGGSLTYTDGRVVPATSAREPRDIPNWLLCPALAPIWGRTCDGWLIDTSMTDWTEPGRARIPLRAVRRGLPDGYADVVWPQAYISTLALGQEHYVLRELDWQPSQTHVIS
jgi:hypothetical protein